MLLKWTKIKLMKNMFLCAIFLIVFFQYTRSIAQDSSYKVFKTDEFISIDGDWNKKSWQNIEPIHINRFMGALPDFKPIVKAKMQYDNENVYIIFQTEDRYIQSLVRSYNGPVSTDACVEFFFSPDSSFPFKYFNLEINASGVSLMRYNDFETKDTDKFEVEDLKMLDIAHSLPSIIDQVIMDSTTWTIECRIPFQVLEKYGGVSIPKSGVIWKANLYKTASKGLNPHWITWAFVDNKIPNFHLPEFFGTLEFQ